MNKDMRQLDKTIRTLETHSNLDLTYLKDIDLQVQQTPTDFGSTRSDSKGMTLSEIQMWSQWIQRRNWTFFVTFTTAYESTPKTMRRLNQRFFDALKNYSNDGLDYFWVLEKHKHRGVHTHGLLNFSGLNYESSLDDIDLAWKMVLNEYVRCAGKLEDYGHHRNSIALYDNSKKAADYCLKYMHKDPQDWDYFLHV